MPLSNIFRTFATSNNKYNLKLKSNMAQQEEPKKSKRGGARPGSGRKVTPYKIPLNVKITQEAADKMATIEKKSEFIDQLIKKAIK